MTTWLTAAEAADQLGTSYQTLLEYTALGKLPAYKLPGSEKRVSLRIRLEDINAFKSGRQQVVVVKWR